MKLCFKVIKSIDQNIQKLCFRVIILSIVRTKHSQDEHSASTAALEVLEEIDDDLDEQGIVFVKLDDEVDSYNTSIVAFELADPIFMHGHQTYHNRSLTILSIS